MTDLNKDNSDGNGRKKKIQYGNAFVGVWRCLNCMWECFPRHLREAEAQPPFLCPDCGTELVYDEEA